MAQPLDVKTIILNNENVPALHPRWKKQIEFLSYKAPPINPDDKAGIEEWLEHTDFIKDDLDILLKMPHHKFWCHAIFDSTLHQCIDSYLHLAPREYDVVYSMPRDMKERQNILHRLFFMTCLRMATHKESKQNYLTPSVFGEIIYENFLFDIPKIMDLCVLYGSANGPLLSKMISNIFTQQPKYWDDLRATLPTIAHVLESVAEKCGICGGLGGGSGSPLKISVGQKDKNPLMSMPLSEFQDIVFYLSDTANTLWSFLDVYPEVAKIFMEEDAFIFKLVTFYESVVPVITEALKGRNWEGLHLKDLLTKKLHQSQVCLIKVFHQMIFQGCLQKLLESPSGDEASHLIEHYINIISAILSEKRFLAHLNYLFPFRHDRDMIAQCKYSVDETRLDFIQEAIGEANAIYIKSKEAVSTETRKDFETPDIKDEPEQPIQIEGAGACAPGVSGVKLQSMISSVKDLLPDLGEGFIELCLDELDYNIEKVINCVLEDKLPPSLNGIDRSMDRDVSKVSTEAEQMESLLDKRLNIYDNDEFDAFRKKVDTSKVILGKKEKAPKSLKELDSQKDLTSLRPLYDKYGSEQVESMYETQYFEYDDEYDDTYDSNLVGADDADSADELTNRRLFTIPQVLGRKDYKSGTRGNTGDSDEDSDDDQQNRKPRDEFIVNPALIRQRQEERRASREQRSGQKGHVHKAPKQYDVVGNAKGQGQEKDTVRNRAWKEKNKSTRVHHNRKVLADKKRKF